MYADLKRKVFTKALEEINKKTGYKLTMIEEKEGRKVIRVRFDFEPDAIKSGLDKRTGKVTTRHQKPKISITKIEETITEIQPNQQELEL